MTDRLLAVVLVMLLIPLLSIGAQQQWDLGVDKVSVSPLNGEVQQGEPLLLSIYVRNYEDRLFSGVIRVDLYIDEELKKTEFWDIGDISKGSIPIPAGGYTTVTTRVRTANLTLGIHDLKVVVSPKDYIDPNLENNVYTLKFSVIPVVSAFIEAEQSMIQGEEYEIKVHIPNPSGNPLDVKVRLFVNGTEIGSDTIYVPPKSISMATFTYIPKSVGSLEFKALVKKEGQSFSEAYFTAEVKPSCDLKLEDVSAPDRVFKGEVLQGKIRISNEGFSPTSVNITVEVDDEILDSVEVPSLRPEETKVVTFSVPTADLSVGNHTITISANPLNAADLDRSDNEYSLVFKIGPLPVSLTAKAGYRTIEVNLTNLGGIIATFDVKIVKEGIEVDSSSVTLDPMGSDVLKFEELDDGNYTVEVFNYGIKVASLRVSLGGGPEVESSNIQYWALVLGIIVALVAYLGFTRWTKKKWPSS